MSKVLVYTSPARGHLYPVMDAALALAARGHAVHVRTLAAEVPVVVAAGLAASPMAPGIEARELDDWRGGSPIASARLAFRTFLARAPLEVEDLRAAIADQRPDLLLVDTNTWGAQAAAEASGLPWATWHPFPLPVRSKDVPPFGPGLAPAGGLLGRLRDALVRPLAMAPLNAFLPAINDLRASVGAGALAEVSTVFVRAPLVLLRSAEPFEYPRSDWPENVARVGPGLWSPPHDLRLELPTARPVVLVTCSTEFQDDGALVGAALEAFGSDPSIQLVCTTGAVDPAQFRAPDGVVVRRFVPHESVLPQACVVVCHGGMGITQRALAMGVPVCAVPWGRDQNEVGRRVEVSGAGTMLSRGRLTPARLRAAVEEARRSVAGAERVRAAFAAAGGGERCADLLEGLLPAMAGASVA
jgi:MGT family glycosyltransferase